MKNIVTESHVEEACLEIFSDLGYDIIFGPEIAPAPEGSRPERQSYLDVVLVDRLIDSIDKLNPSIPKEAKEEALKKVLRLDSPNMIIGNERFHRMLVDGIDIEYRKGDRIIGDKVWLVDFNKPERNEFLAINQFTIIEENNNRRPDIVIFVNGLPLGIIELKNIADENATIKDAFNQIQTYKKQIPSIFRFNEILVTSDGNEARAGTITSDEERFMPWKTIDGKKPSKNTTPRETLIRGMFDKEIVLDLIRNFIVYEKDKEKTSKKLAAYHQYNAANEAVKSTLKAVKGDKRAGVVWHTQGSGKSLTMVFYTGKMILTLDNPTLVVLTDRNDLDDQLYDTFSRCKDLLRQEPKHADSREKIKELLKVASGGVIFTTIQKFFPEEKGEKYPLLSDRRNILVIADEAHRSQYDFIDGFARNMRDALPNASFIGFTGTPIEKEDRSTPAVFGKYVDTYDINQSVEDGSTVKIYYENRLAKLDLKPEERPKIDKNFEEVTERQETETKEKLKSTWARLEKVVGSDSRIKKIAEDIVDHFEKRVESFEGKGMIVCMSRRICVELYNEIIKLRPQLHSNDDDKGFIKVIMTGSASDPLEWQDHIRNKLRRKSIGDRLKDPTDPLKLVIVRDMWLTGFDAPCLHTMYVDKPMRGHGLMQAIARVNRVFKDKPGGLIVDYIGIAHDLKKALSDYTERDRDEAGIPQEEAVALMLEKYEVAANMLHGFDYKKFFKLKSNERLAIIPQAVEHILKQENGKQRYVKVVAELLKSFALAVPHEKALEIKDEVGLFQAIKSAMMKIVQVRDGDGAEVDSAIRQILSNSIISDRVVDIFAAAGLEKPNIAILSEEFLMEVKEMPHKNLAFEMLKKLLNDEIKIRMKYNLVRGKSFMDMLEKTIKKYTNRAIETAQIIEELMELARKMRESEEKDESSGLTKEEIAFYDALAENKSAIEVLGDKNLRIIAKEVADIIRKNTAVDWTLRESVQAKLRVLVKKVLKKYGYPPDKQQKATDTVLEQAALMSKNLTEVQKL